MSGHEDLVQAFIDAVMARYDELMETDRLLAGNVMFAAGRLNVGGDLSDESIRGEVGDTVGDDCEQAEAAVQELLRLRNTIELKAIFKALMDRSSKFEDTDPAMATNLRFMAGAIVGHNVHSDEAINSIVDEAFDGAGQGRIEKIRQEVTAIKQAVIDLRTLSAV